MKISKTEYDVGVIVGRFQAQKLHSEHISLIKEIVENHSRTIIFLGVSKIQGNSENALDFQSRKQMIQEIFPDVDILYIQDKKYDDAWSSELDNQISALIPPGKSVRLYGSRGSFISRYTGKYPTEELIPEVYVSATELRRIASNTVENIESWRTGVIWSATNRYTTCYCTVDAIIYNKDMSKVLLVKRPDERKYRFPGGYSDVQSVSLEDDVIREVKEETRLNVIFPIYKGSMLVDDWRYRYIKDKIKTVIFEIIYTGNETPVASDDISGGDAKWFNCSEILPLEDEHKPIWKKFGKWKVEYGN